MQHFKLMNDARLLVQHAKLLLYLPVLAEQANRHMIVSEGETSSAQSCNFGRLVHGRLFRHLVRFRYTLLARHTEFAASQPHLAVDSSSTVFGSHSHILSTETSSILPGWRRRFEGQYPVYRI